MIGLELKYIYIYTFLERKIQHTEEGLEIHHLIPAWMVNYHGKIRDRIDEKQPECLYTGFRNGAVSSTVEWIIFHLCASDNVYH